MNELSPRERRQARTREEILSAALTLINEEGPQGLSLRELAKRVDYSPAGLYEYFDSKEDLIDTVCAEGDRLLRESLLSVSRELPTDTYLVELGMAYVSFARDNYQHYRLMFTNVPEGPRISMEELVYDETYRILVDGVQRGIDSGLFSVDEEQTVHTISYSLWALAHGISMLQLTNLRLVNYDFELVDRLSFEALIRGLGFSAQ